MRSGVSTKILGALMIPLLVTPALAFPKKTEAQASCAAGIVGQYIAGTALGSVIGLEVPSKDKQTNMTTGGSYMSDCILKPIAINMARTMARNISNSIVNWINNDFQGKPGFVTDINGMLSDSADEVIGSMIYGSDLRFLCRPFSFKIRLALATKYSQPFREKVRCTLSDVTGNVNRFVKNNGGVGWNNWLEISTNPQNNVYGAYLMAESRLASNLNNEFDKVNNMLNRNGGFLDFRVCKEWETDTDGDTSNTYGSFDTAYEPEDTSNTDGSFDLAYGPETKFGAGTAQRRCKTYETKTPGSLVQGQASKVLGSWADQLNLADDIDQIVGALISHFADKMISGAQGFLGLSGSRGYAKSNVGFEQALALSEDVTNPENAGLNAANLRANQEMSRFGDLLAATSISSGESIATGAAVYSTFGLPSTNADAATDGDLTSTALVGAPMGENAMAPWIQIELSAVSDIAEVHIWRPEGSDASQMIGTFDVVVSESVSDRDWVSTKYSLAPGSPNPSVVTVNQKAKFIKIERFDNAYECGDELEQRTCYRPLQISEIEVLPPSATVEDSGEIGTGETGLPISFGPTTGDIDIARGREFKFEVPVRATKPVTAKSIDIRLYYGSNPLAFASFSTNGISIKQNGFTKTFYPENSPGVSFSSVNLGGSNDVSVIMSGNVLPSAKTGSYKFIITAVDLAGNTADTTTINFVVQ